MAASPPTDWQSALTGPHWTLVWLSAEIFALITQCSYHGSIYWWTGDSPRLDELIVSTTTFFLVHLILNARGLSEWLEASRQKQAATAGILVLMSALVPVMLVSGIFYALPATCQIFGPRV